MTQNIDVGFFFYTNKQKKKSQIDPLCSTQLSLFQRNNMGNLCICSMQVHQSGLSLSPSSSSTPQIIHSGFVPRARGFYVPRFASGGSPRSRSLPRCCSWPPFSEPGRGTCTYLHPGTDTCTRWPRRAGCCGETGEISLH